MGSQQTEENSEVNNIKETVEFSNEVNSVCVCV